MNRAEKLEELLSSKAFDELTLPEKELVLQELGSEEQYEAMRKIGVTLVKKTTGLSPDPQILRSLQRRMRDERKSNRVYQLLSWEMPAYITLPLLVVASMITWFIAREPNIKTRPLTLVKTDTVYVVSQPDTVYKERIIYRYAKLKTSFPQNLQHAAQAEVQSQPTIRGVNMKESEALEKLLVSGSR